MSQSTLQIVAFTMSSNIFITNILWREVSTKEENGTIKHKFIQLLVQRFSDEICPSNQITMKTNKSTFYFLIIYIYLCFYCTLLGEKISW